MLTKKLHDMRFLTDNILKNRKSVTAKEALRQLRKWKSILILLENIYHHISVRWKWHQKKLKKWRSGKPEKTGFIRITWKGKQMASSRKELLDWLKALKDEKVVDIRKVYKNGVTDSVIDSYRSYLKQWKGWTVMVIVKLIIRILLLPVRISLTIVQLVVMFITWLSATVFHILSGIICITAILGYGFGQEIKQWR